MDSKDQPYKPKPKHVQKLIEDAKNHPLGLEFLKGGHVEAVAITFETHVFTVEAARKDLSKKKHTSQKRTLSPQLNP
jgi:hypothetical protein